MKKENKKATQEQEQHELIGEVDPQNVNLVDLIDMPAWKTILIDLVKSEKMDPWQIDIAVLADKYLAKIQLLQGHDLRIPANAILASAILLKFKSRVLRVSEIEPEETEKREMTEEERQQIEGMLPGLESLRKEREGKVSLDELVENISNMLDESKSRVDNRFRQDDKPEFKIPFGGVNIEELVDHVMGLIQKKADSQGLVVFSNLVEGKSITEIVDTFLPCLFLVTKGKINMWQDEFFGEIMISITKQ